MGHFWCISVDFAHTNLHIVMEVNTDINHDIFCTIEVIQCIRSVCNYIKCQFDSV